MADAQILGVDVTRSDSTAQFAVGTVAQVGQTVYEYCLSTSGATAYKAYLIDEDGDASTAAAHSATLPGKLGVPQATIAATEYGWVARQGKITVLVLADCAKDVVLYTSATAGSLDDASGSQTKIPGFRIDTTDSGSGSAIAGTAAIPLAINL